VPLYAALVASNLLAWAWAIAAFHGLPVLMGAAALAYAFGLRHAVDADHIAAIDNVTRKLMREGRRPISVGLWFSLGHSTVVVLACAGIAMTSATLRAHLAGLKETGSLVGTAVSAAFLVFIALANIAALVPVWHEFRRVRAGAAGPHANIEARGPAPGIVGRVLRPLLRFVSAPRDMFLVGFLFGLGFDTASEIGLLGISASQAAPHAPLWPIMVFPALFAAGMSLVDTTDGVAMTGAYGWAFAKPERKLLYNFAITLLSILAALFVGGLETLNLLGAHGHWSGRFWHWIAASNVHFGLLGCAIITAALGLWGISVLVSRLCVEPAER
jgi:high-affinity nickel-transport protein